MGVESWMTLGVLLLLIHLISVDKGHFGLVLGCQQIERDALSQFKHSLNDTANRLSSWKGEDCCRWHGVHCNNVTGHVEILDLHQNPTIYDHGYEASKLEPCLLELKELRYLDLSGIYFEESKIPKFIGSMKQLRYLNLSYAGFSGVIPPQLGNLTRLRVLELGQNFNLFVDDLHWVSGLLKLQYLGMNGVDFTKAHDSMMQAISRLPSLLELRLQNCKLGTNHLSHAFLANSTWLSTIQHLDLSFNFLEGHFPSVITNLTSLKSLDLSWNQYTGPIPLQIGDMGKLEYLNFAYNSFSHIEGGLAEEIIGKLCKLKELDFSSNQLEGDILGSRKNVSKCSTYDLEILDLEFNKITSTLPYWLGELQNLTDLHLEDNRLFGQIPESIGSLSFLKVIDLSTNSLNGTIPSSLGGLTSLQTLDFSQNDLNGCIPSSLGGLSSLQYLVLSQNSLNGTIPSFHNRCSLTDLDLSNNLLSKIPEYFGCKTLSFVNLSSNVLEGNVSNHHLDNLSVLDTLDLSNNSLLNLKFSSDWKPPFQLTQFLMRACRIQGHLPQWIQTQKYLDKLDLSYNQISGEMLQWFQNQWLSFLDLSYNRITGPITSFSSNLVHIDLSHNLLSGPIPQDNSTYNGLVRNSLCHLEFLSYLNLQNNELSGTIPDCWGNSENLNVINLSFNKLSGLIPMTIGLLPHIEFLNLSSNSLEGEIPSTLSSCEGLVMLDLGENKLSGEIPEKMGDMGSLESLDLSNNNLSGTIPSSISDLTFLGYLNLSYNNLQGPIPTGNQFDTFTSTTYAGNPGLCGYPLPKKCERPSGSVNIAPTEQESLLEDYRDKMILFVTTVLGFIIGFWGVIGGLQLKKTWRFALFRWVENTMDFVYVQVMVRINRLMRT